MGMLNKAKQSRLSSVMTIFLEYKTPSDPRLATEICASHPTNKMSVHAYNRCSPIPSVARDGPLGSSASNLWKVNNLPIYNKLRGSAWCDPGRSDTRGGRTHFVFSFTSSNGSSCAKESNNGTRLKSNSPYCIGNGH